MGPETKEADALERGPYPPWNEWRKTLEDGLNIKLDEMRNGVEAIFKEAYRTRRLIQLGADYQIWFEFLDKVDEEHPGLLDEHIEIIRFIVGKTESEEIKKGR